MMWRWVLVAALLIVGSVPQMAAAEEHVDISVEIPLEGVYKYTQWVRLEVGVYNHLPEPFAGTLLYGPDNMDYRDQSLYRQPLSLPPGESKTYHIDVPTEILMNGRSAVRVMQGDELVAAESLLPLNPKGDPVFGVVNQSQSAFHFMGMGSDPSTIGTLPFTVQHVNPDALPEESWILKNLDVLAIGNLSHNDMTDAQLAAIAEWIKRGGVLVLTAGPGDDQLMERFQQLIRVPAGKSGVRTDLTELSQLAGVRTLPFDQLPVYHQEYPLFTVEKRGIGTVIFANFDVTEEPIASWQHNHQLWQKVFRQYKVMDSVRAKEERPAMDLSLTQLSRFMPDIHMPSLGWIIGIWVIYVLVVAPGLYWMLKRKDRREWAWGMIPAAALLLSIGVFLIGRPLVVKEDTSFSVSTVRILDKSLAEVQTSASFLTVSGGNYQVEAEKGFLAIPRIESRNGMYSEGGVLSDREDIGKLITFENVPYLTIKQALAAGVLRDLGAFDAKLTVRNGRFAGTVRNETTFDYKEVYVDLGMQRFALGEMKQGEEKQVNVPIEQYFASPHALNGDSQFDKQTREQYIAELKENLTNPTAVTTRITAIHEEALPTLRMNHGGRHHFWNMITQQVELTPAADGSIIYPYGTLPVHVVNQDGNLDSRYPNIWDLSKGSVTFGLQMDSSLRINRLEVPLEQSPYRPFKKEVFHAQSGQWRELKRDEHLTITQVAEYVNRDGMILIRFTNETEQRLSLPQPFFQVEGEEKTE